VFNMSTACRKRAQL